MKLNCWEYKKCGREPGGSKIGELGVCSASNDPRLDGVHGGKNGGRACWVLTKTFCKGEIQGSFGEKYKDCSTCSFYEKVKAEEYPNFKLSATLLNLLTNDSGKN